MSPPTNGNLSVLWQRIANAGTRRTRVVAPEPPDPEPDGPDLGALVPWLGLRAFEQAFLPWLDKEIAQVESQERLHLHSHADLAYWIGRKDSLRVMRATLTDWAGQGVQPPPAHSKAAPR